jgi:hypothetical protein
MFAQSRLVSETVPTVLKWTKTRPYSCPMEQGCATKPRIREELGAAEPVRPDVFYGAGWACVVISLAGSVRGAPRRAHMRSDVKSIYSASGRHQPYAS